MFISDAADLAVTGEENDKHKPRTEMECNRRGWDSAWSSNRRQEIEKGEEALSHSQERCAPLSLSLCKIIKIKKIL